MDEKDVLFYSLTFIVIVCYLMIAALFSVGAAFFLFFAPFYAPYFIITGVILVTSILIFGIIALLKCLIVFIHKLCKAKKSTLIRNQILIGLSGILICSILPRILVYFVEFTEYFALFSTCLPCVISVALYFLFVFECDKRYECDSITNEKPYWIMGALHALLLIVTIKIAISSGPDEKTITSIVLYQIFSTFFCFPTIFDLYAVLSGTRKLVEGVDEEEEAARNGGNVRLESVRVVPKAEEVPRFECEDCKKREFLAAQAQPKIECKICLLEYSEALIPRILNGCGHTICEKCAGTLLNKNERKFLFCPFCQEVTAVNGQTNMLQKNYGILDIANNMKN